MYDGEKGDNPTQIYVDEITKLEKAVVMLLYIVEEYGIMGSEKFDSEIHAARQCLRQTRTFRESWARSE